MFNIILNSYSEVMVGDRQGLVQYMNLSKEEEDGYMVVEKMKGRHNKTVWHRVTRKQIRKVKFEDDLDISELAKTEV